MKSRFTPIISSLYLPALLILSGCGQAKVSGRPELAKVSGTVTFKQEPVEGATVIFVPQGHSNAAVSMTDAKGNFTLQSFDPGDGAALGTYQVIVKKVEIDGEKERHLLPEKYSLSDKSGLMAEVKAEGKNVFSFELK